MKSKITKTVSTTIETRIELTSKDIMDLLKTAGIIEGKQKCTVIFNVPGGGDWTSMPIEIDKDNPICISCLIETSSKE